MLLTINRSLLLAMLIFMSAGVGLAQKQKYKDYRAKSAKSNLDIARAILEDEPLKSLDLLSTHLKQNIKSISPRDESEVYQLTGKANYYLGQYDLALENYLKARGPVTKKSSRLSKVPFTPPISLDYNLGEVYLVLKEYDNSIRHLNRFITNTRPENDGYLKTVLMIARAHMENGDLDEAKKEAERAKALAESNNDIDQRTASNFLLGEILVKKGDESLAKRFYQNVLDINSSTKEEDDLSGENLMPSQNKLSKDASEAIGEILSKEDNIEEELKFKKEVLQESVKQNDVVWQNSLNLDIAEIYLKDDRADEAIPYLNESVNLSEKIGDIEQNIKARKSLSNVYASQGNYNAALDNYKTYVGLVDKLYENKQKEIRLSNEVQQSLFRNQETINLLEKDKELNQSEIQLLEIDRALKEESIAKQRLWIYGLIAFISIILVSGYLLYRNISQKKVANQLLALKSLRSQMNPHFIFNALNSVNSFISKNDTRQANKYLSEFSKLMRTVMENSQNDFVPLSEEIETLELYLKLEHFRFQDKFEYDFHVSSEVGVDDYRIPPMLIQPYIENAIWHGLRYKEEQGHLSVSISENDSSLLMSIEDDGIGRTKSKELKTINQKSHQSTGMKNTESRIRLINDTYNSQIEFEVVDLNNEEKTGTHVKVRIPKKLIE